MWYIARDKKKSGPFTTEQLESLAKQGKLRSSDLVWQQGMENWVPGASLPETSKYFKSTTAQNAAKKTEGKSDKPTVRNVPKPEPIEELEVLEEEEDDVVEEEEEVPIVRAKKNKNKNNKKNYVIIREVEPRRSGLSFFKLIGYMSGAIFLLVASLCIFFAAKGVEQAEKRIEEVKDRTLQGDNDKILPASIGIPLEIEPNHYIIFDGQGNGELVTYLDNLIGNQFALRIHDNSHIYFSITNSTNDGKVWEWESFSDVGPLTDEFGNKFKHKVVRGQVESSTDLLKFLDNRAMTIHPSKLNKQILLFDKMPDTSKRFTIDLKYGKTLIKLSGEKNTGNR